MAVAGAIICRRAMVGLPQADSAFWQAHLNRGQAEKIFGIGHRETKNCSPAEVLPGQRHGTYIQVSNQVVKIVGRGLAIVVALPIGGVSESAQVYGEDAMLLRITLSLR